MSDTELATQVGPVEAIGAVIAAEGNLDLAAERCFGTPKKDQIHPKARLVAAIASDPTASRTLSEQLRVLTLLQAFQSVREVGHVVDGTLEKFDMADLGRLYNNLLGVVNSLTQVQGAQQQGNVNLIEMVFNQLPPEVQQAIKVLNGPTGPEGAGESNIIEYQPRTWLAEDLGPPNAANGN